MYASHQTESEDMRAETTLAEQHFWERTREQRTRVPTPHEVRNYATRSLSSLA